MSESSEGPSREQQIYWQEFVQLKADSCYVRDYRNYLGKWVTVTSAIRAVASMGGIAGWLIWKQYAWVWACIVAASQVIEALKNVFPFYKRRGALSKWSGRSIGSLSRRSATGMRLQAGVVQMLRSVNCLIGCESKKNEQRSSSSHMDLPDVTTFLIRHKERPVDSSL